MNIHLRSRFLAILLIVIFTTGSCVGKGSMKIPLVIFAADSLIIPFGDVEKAFESKYPTIDVQAEYHGSIQVIRQVTDLHRPADVVATADASLVPMLMYAANDPDTGRPYASWYIRFASNHLALAYHPGSLYAAEINAGNWYTLLERPDVKVGIADPRFDATGYRALMALTLAQGYYGQPTLFQDVLSGNFTYPFGIFSEGALTTITVPEIVETKPGSHIVIRGTSNELIALLESGNLDYAFEYESVIQQHGLKMVQLPDAINLGEEEYDQNYSTVQVNLDFQRFNSVEPQFRGERIAYGITSPSNAPHPKEADLFISFLLGPEGSSIMLRDHHPIFDPSIGDRYGDIPQSLQALCTPATPAAK